MRGELSSGGGSGCGRSGGGAGLAGGRGGNGCLLSRVSLLVPQLHTLCKGLWIECPSCKGRLCDVLTLGSFPGPLALFSSRAVDEKLDVKAGVLAVALRVAGVRKMETAALNGRKAGRKDERFIVWATTTQLHWC